jgi:hypothetical protein
MRAFAAGSAFLALALTPLIPVATAQAAPLPSAPAETGTVIKSIRADVDGNGKPDTVELIRLTANRFRLQVRTAEKVASVEFTADPADVLDATRVWHGAASLDGVKGAELVVNLWSAQRLQADLWSHDIAVYTWRHGALVAERAPAATRVKHWYLGDPETDSTQGYRFFTKSGRHYVDVSDLTRTSTSWKGRITGSVWRNGNWVKVSTRKVQLPFSKADPYLSFNGPTILLGTLRADIDGDGRTDQLTYYRYSLGSKNASRYGVRIATAAGRILTKKLSALPEDPFTGVATLDGVPGGELIFLTDNELQNWTVLTWRGGSLVKEPAPKMCARDYAKWSGCSDEDITNLTFSVVEGTPTLVVTDIYADGAPGVATLEKFSWQSNQWAKVSQWTEQLTQEQVDVLATGFFGVGIVKP